MEELIKNIGNYQGVTADSRAVRPGFIFVAVKGATSDGHKFISHAILAGAKLIIGQEDIKVEGALYLKVNDSRDALGLVASEFYGNPSKKLKVIGVTGTKGKTTTSHIIYHILSGMDQKVGLISSIEAKIGERNIDTGFHVTSPDTVTLHKLLKEMVDAGCKYAVIEVSSHGIDQKRIAGVNFDVGVLTNIAPEHLDYHKTFAEYKKVKMSFINSCKIKIIGPEKTEINALPGFFNNLDAQAAVSAVEALGFNREKAINTLETFKLPQGRLEEIKNDKGFKIYIDFAHTPNSLEAVLKHLRTQGNGRLISVFGCAGERDRLKRFQMGKISAKLADFSIFTAEDPRSENIYDIMAKMREGAISSGKVEGRDFVRIPERGEAIAYALSIASPGDVVGFFGKGHEKSMAYDGFEHPWSDHEVVDNFLNKDDKISAIILAAGKGSRMKSAKPKILHEICGRPMISYSLQNLRASKVGEIIAVVSYRKNLVIKEIFGAVKIAVQKNPKGGTGDAVRAGLPFVSRNSEFVMVLYGDDTSFYTPETIRKILELHNKNLNILTFITLVKDDPHGLGRIIRSEDGNVLEIIEEKDATDEQRKIKEVNDGLYVFDKKWLEENINKIIKNPITGEFYINELIRQALQTKKITAYKLPTDSEWQGVNTPEELAKAEERMKEKLENYHG